MLALIQTIVETAFRYGSLMLIHGTILALVTGLLSVTVLRRTRPAFRAVLWLIVLTKFLVPPILPGEMALSGWISRISGPLTVNRLVGIQPSRGPENVGVPDSLASNGGGAHTSLAGLWLFSTYLALVFLLTVRSLWIFVRTNRHLCSLQPDDGDLQDEVRALSQRISVTRVPEVRWSDEALTPYIFGFWRPMMVMPRALIKHLEPWERRALILHELAHVRRRDVLVRLFQGAARIVFFFFPPVLWVCRRIDNFAEMACDEWAVSISGVEPDEYASALIKVVRVIKHGRQLQMGIALLRDARLIESRVRAVLSLESCTGPRLPVSLKILLIVWLFFSLLGGSQLNMPARAEESTTLDISEANAWADQTPPQQLRSSVSRVPSLQKELAKTASMRIRQSQKSIERSAETADPWPSASQENMQGPRNAELTPYERGVLLARQFLREKANAEKSQNNSPMQSSTSGRDADAKREIELRVQERLRHPF